MRITQTLMWINVCGRLGRETKKIALYIVKGLHAANPTLAENRYAQLFLSNLGNLGVLRRFMVASMAF